MFSLIAAVFAYRRQNAAAAVRMAPVAQPGRRVANDRTDAFARAA